MGSSDGIKLGIWIGSGSAGGRALVDCVFGSIVFVYTGCGSAMEVSVHVVHNLWFGRQNYIVRI